jgi:Flp pilus assembly CpaF family ATPase
VRSKVLRIDEAAAREKIHDLLVTGDNRLKQGVSTVKIRQSYEQALAVAREAGLEESVRPLIDVRLADLERLEAGSPPSAPPAG